MESNVYNSRLHPININMRCIEIKHISILIKGQAWININMRCIEIMQALAVQQCGYGLTLT